MATSVADKRAAFRSLHEDAFFVLPNPWDLGSAVLLQHLGFKALATTSAGMAWSMGRADGDVSLEQALHHFSQLARASDLPVNADFENAFGDAPDEVARNVALAVDTGIAGLSVEDYSGSMLYEFDLAVARVAAARAALDRTGSGVLLTGRAEGFLRGAPQLDEVIRRLKAYSAAGADCLYAPGSRRESDPRRRGSRGAQSRSTCSRPEFLSRQLRAWACAGSASAARWRASHTAPSTPQPKRSPTRAHSGDSPAYPAGGFSIRSFPPIVSGKGASASRR